MNNKLLYALAAVGVLFGLYSAVQYSRQPKPQPPVFSPSPNPYAHGIYANGIVESYQAHGANINIYPEVSGPIVRVLVAEGDTVAKGAPLIEIDDSIQRATALQQKSQAEAAQAMLDELRAQPRKETLDVAAAQVVNARASLKTAQDQLAKQEASFRLDAQSVSRDTLDNARNAEKMAEANLAVVQRQYDLTRAGAWEYDIRNQERQYQALLKSYESSNALLEKYTVRAPIDGVVLSVQAAAGSYVSPQGAYDSYTQGVNPLIVMGTPQSSLEVRTYVDEILVHRLPDPSAMVAQMSIRGTDIKIPLTFLRMQPLISPKIELSDQRRERVDVRVLPVIFRFDKPKNLNIYPGQLVDVYIGEHVALSAAPVQAGGGTK